MGRPWRVARTRREHREWWPVNFMGAVWVDIACCVYYTLLCAFRIIVRDGFEVLRRAGGEARSFGDSLSVLSRRVGLQVKTVCFFIL